MGFDGRGDGIGAKPKIPGQQPVFFPARHNLLKFDAACPFKLAHSADTLALKACIDGLWHTDNPVTECP
ncbi:hypothetical protein D3C81_2248880 [compost metagenome]